MTVCYRTDVLIIGGGPAGCAAAIAARRAGLSVILVESQAEARPAPGETLHPGIEPVLKQLGVWNDVLAARFHRHHGVWKESDGRRLFEAYGEDDNGAWFGFQADRHKLQIILQKAVANAGAELSRRVYSRSVLKTESRVVGVATTESEFCARWVFDATGRRAWLARALGLNEERLSPALRIRFGWNTTQIPELDGQPLFRQHSQGWDWHAPLGNGRSAWAKLRYVVSSESSNIRTQNGVDLSWRVYRTPAGPGYFLLGDSAALLDPASSSGVLRALLSGIFAVHLIQAVVRGHTDEQTANQTYCQWIGDMFDRYTTELRDLYFPGSGAS